LPKDTAGPLPDALHPVAQGFRRSNHQSAGAADPGLEVSRTLGKLQELEGVLSATEKSVESHSRPKTPTLEHIARRAGVSVMTVSRALRGYPGVRETTRKKILELAAELKYRPNRWARSLVTRRSRIIGIVVPDISHIFFSEITRGVQDGLERYGYSLMLCHSKGDARREAREIDILIGAQVEGVIVASEQPEDSPELFADLLEREIPFVLVDRFFPSLWCPRVVVDDFQVGFKATWHLIELGHTRIGHIAGPAVSTARLRTEGYRAAMKEAGIRVRSSWIARADFKVSGGAEAMRKLLAGGGRVTAVFASNDPSAFGAVHACREAGLRVPEDVSVIGAGNIEGSQHPAPFLTTIAWPVSELGERAAEILLEQLDGCAGDSPSECVFQPEILLRKSTAPPAGAPPRKQRDSKRQPLRTP